MGENYLNSLISLVSKSDIRYEGILYNINMEESSIALSQVRSFGTEGRRVGGPQVPPSNEVYDYIIFKGDDIKDLTVLGPPGTVPGSAPAAPPAPAPPPPSQPLQPNPWAPPPVPTAQPYAAPVYGTDQWAPAAPQQQQPPQPQAPPPPQPAYSASAPPVAPASAQKVAPQVQIAPAAPRAPPAPQQPPPKPSNYAQAAAVGRGGAPGRGPAPGPAFGGRGGGRGGPHQAPYQVNGGRGAPGPMGGRGPYAAPAPRPSAPPGAAASAAPGAASSPMALPVPTEDFNFEEQNAKFKKEEMAREIAEAVKPRGSYSRDDFFDAISCETLERMNLDTGAGPAVSAAPGAPRMDGGRGDGRQRAADARRLDMETFGGLGGLRHNYNYGGRGRGRGGRGRGDTGGRGGGRDGGSGGGRGLRPHATGVPNAGVPNGGGGRGGRGRN